MASMRQKRLGGFPGWLSVWRDNGATAVSDGHIFSWRLSRLVVCLVAPTHSVKCRAWRPIHAGWTAIAYGDLSWAFR